MASASVGMIGGSWVNGVGERKKQKRNSNSEGRVRISCAYSSSSSSSSVVDPYKTLRIKPGASESEVKKAFRRLALQYHPDVCKGSNGRVQFQAIYEAYDMLMDRLKDEGPLREEEEEEGYYDQGIYEPMRGRNDPDYDLWEEWMGWEGAGIRDYSSHINPYI